MDPLGFPFEIFDDFGRFRTEENLEHPDNVIKPANRNETNEIYIPPGERLGDKVIEVREVCKSFGDRVLIQPGFYVESLDLQALAEDAADNPQVARTSTSLDATRNSNSMLTASSISG